MSIVLCDNCNRQIDTDEDVEAYCGFEPDTPHIKAETCTATTVDRWLCWSCRCDEALPEMAMEKMEELRRERDAWKEQAGHWETEARSLQARLMDLEAQP